MRNEVKITLPSGIWITLREIRPCDVMRAITIVTLGKENDDEIPDNEFSTALLEGSDLIEYPRSLSESENTMINIAFLQLNKSYFAGNNSHKSAENKTTVRGLLRLAKTLNDDCARLIYLHHLNCWNYGWQFFLAVKEQFKA
jgi:hypothetical protein